MRSSKRVLVTGGAGFIGSHLCRRLLRDGSNVICVDNYRTGTERNIIELISDPRFDFIRHDVVMPLSMQVDQIYNLACPASPIHYQSDPVQTLKTSVLGAMNILDLARNVGARVLQASTSEVYGDPEVHPQIESYWGRVNPIGLRACYDEGKRCAETLFFDYHRLFSVDIRLVRIFNTYGPHMHPKDGRVVSNFIVQALKDQPITLFGEGTQTRSFQYIDDLIDGLILMMNNPDGFIGPVNIGNPCEVTVRELAELILELVPESKSPLVYRPLPSDDPRQRRPDIRTANEKLGWNPRITLADGLRQTINYFRESLGLS